MQQKTNKSSTWFNELQQSDRLTYNKQAEHFWVSKDNETSTCSCCLSSRCFFRFLWSGWRTNLVSDCEKVQKHRTGDGAVESGFYRYNIYTFVCAKSYTGPQGINKKVYFFVKVIILSQEKEVRAHLRFVLCESATCSSN